MNFHVAQLSVFCHRQCKAATLTAN